MAPDDRSIEGRGRRSRAHNLANVSLSRRVRGWLVVAAAVCVATPVAVAAIPIAAMEQREAMDRCTETPPGFPRELIRLDTRITVEWRFFPPGYDCVYSRNGRVVAERPPP
jgi:hypothetical protein